MIRYNTDYSPPAPVVSLQVSSLAGSERLDCAGKLDTGADISVIPDHVVRKLELRPKGEMRIRSYDGESAKKTFYYVKVHLERQEFEDIFAVSAPRNEMLLGRDVLNQLNILLEGKKLSFEVSDP